MLVTIYHNPSCRTSRNVLQAIEGLGYSPLVVEYLKIGWTITTLKTLLADAGLSPVSAIRKKQAEDIGFNYHNASDDAVLQAMVQHPALVERPFVVTPHGTRLCRPAEKLNDILWRQK